MVHGWKLNPVRWKKTGPSFVLGKKSTLLLYWGLIQVSIFTDTGAITYYGSGPSWDLITNQDFKLDKISYCKVSYG